MSKRIPRVNQLIKKELSQIILREIEFPREVLVTVTRVETSVDLNRARVFISCLPEIQSKEILEILNRQIYEIQQKMNKRLKMKFVPRIEFVEEKKTKEAGRIEEILEELKKERK
jgi:ribosome-binding factor A